MTLKLLKLLLRKNTEARHTDSY